MATPLHRQLNQNKLNPSIISAIGAFLKWLVGGKSAEERKKSVLNVARALRSISKMRMVKDEQVVSDAARDSELPSKYGAGLSKEARSILESSGWAKECSNLINLLQSSSSREVLTQSARTMEEATWAFSRGEDSDFTAKNEAAAKLVEEIKKQIIETSDAASKLRDDQSFKLGTDFKALAGDIGSVERLFDLNEIAGLEEAYSKVMLTVENALEQIQNEIKRISKEDKSTKGNGQALTKQFKEYWSQVRTVMEAFRHVRRVDNAIKELAYTFASYRIGALELASKNKEADSADIKSALSEMRAIKKEI